MIDAIPRHAVRFDAGASGHSSNVLLSVMESHSVGVLASDTRVFRLTRGQATALARDLAYAVQDMDDEA